MKTIKNTIIGFTLTIAAAGMSFAAQAPAAPAAPASGTATAPMAKKHVKKHTTSATKPAAATTAPATTTAKPTSPASK